MSDEPTRDRPDGSPRGLAPPGSGGPSEGLAEIPRPTLRTALVAAVLLSASLAILFGRAVERPLNHDEHQFVASGALLATEGLMPYVDYPYFHMPYLPFVYGALFAFTDHLLLAARSFSVLCAWLTLLLLFVGTWRTWRSRSENVALLMASGVLLLVLLNPLFVYTSGLSWNHDLPTLLMVAAFFAHLRALRTSSGRAAFLAGTLIGLAAGVRLSYAALVVPFALGAALATSRGTRLGTTRGFLAGFGLGMLPALTLFAVSPGPFVFGNIGYIRVNTLFREQMDFAEAMTWTQKAYFLLTKVMNEPSTLLLATTFVLVAWPGRWMLRPSRRRGGTELLFATLAIPFTWGSLAATPVWMQYFYAPLPLVAIGVAYGLKGTGPPDSPERGLIGRLFLVAVGVTVVQGSWRERESLLVGAPATWTTSEIHAAGVEVARAARGGQVLTVAPIYPLEGGAKIYPELATGPFAWRTSGLMEPGPRAERKVMGREDLAALPPERRPAAVLIADDDDQQLESWALDQGFELVGEPHGKRLWIDPDDAPADVRSAALPPRPRR